MKNLQPINPGLPKNKTVLSYDSKHKCEWRDDEVFNLTWKRCIICGAGTKK